MKHCNSCYYFLSDHTNPGQGACANLRHNEAVNAQVYENGTYEWTTSEGFCDGHLSWDDISPEQAQSARDWGETLLFLAGDTHE